MPTQRKRALNTKNWEKECEKEANIDSVKRLCTLQQSANIF